MAYSSAVSLETVEDRMLTLQEQRVLVQEREKQIVAEYKAVKEVLKSKDIMASHTQLISKPVTSTGLSLQDVREHEQKKLRTQIAELNELQFAVQTREVQLQELEQSLKGLELYNALDVNEEKYEQVIRQLENCQEKMSLKITEAEKIHNTYLRLQEHLQKEVREMPQALDKLCHTVLSGRSELSKMETMSQSALTAVDSTKSMLLQMKSQLMQEKKGKEKELREAEARKEKEVEARIVQEREGESYSTGAVKRMRELGKKAARKDLAEQTEPSALLMGQPSKIQSSCTQCSDKLEDGESMSCTNLQELKFQKDLREHAINCEILVEHLLQDLHVLELQYSQLKFSSSPDSQQHKKLKRNLAEELDREQQRCTQRESRLYRTQAVLQSMEKSINNLYYRMICVGPKDIASEGSLDGMARLREISARLLYLETLQMKSEKQDELEREKMWDFLEQSTMMEPKNCKCVSSFVHSDSIEALKISSEEEDSPLSRDEIKRQGIQVIKSQQPKNKVQKTFKRS